jgi:hypothetical protein
MLPAEADTLVEVVIANSGDVASNISSRAMMEDGDLDELM